MKKNDRSISAMALCAAMALPAVAAPPSANAITAEFIADTLNAAGMKVSARQVTLLADVVASTSKPALRVESMERWGDHRMKVRLACDSNTECLPFLVAVNWSGDDAMPVRSSSSAAISPAKSASDSIVVHAGAPAILLLDGDHVHIQLPVFCLESGAAGQTVRVVSKEQRKTFTAQVFSESVLKGRL
jgi:hypothetical protein